MATKLKVNETKVHHKSGKIGVIVAWYRDRGALSSSPLLHRSEQQYVDIQWSDEDNTRTCRVAYPFTDNDYLII